MPDSSDLAGLRSYHADRTALLDPGAGPSVFGLLQEPSFACTCAELCRLAYTHFEEGDGVALRNALQPAALQLAGAWSNDGAQAFAVRAADARIFVVFRGTQADDPTDLGTDADFRLVHHAEFPGRVHAGFARAFLSLKPQLDERLRGVPAAKLIFTGHSLGAAMATLAASLQPGSQLVTFGSPRVGDPAFVHGCAGVTVQRYVDCCDIVTEVPPEALLGYAHVGPMHYIDRTGKVQAAEPGAERLADDRTRARLQYLAEYAFISGTVAVRELADHAPANYIRAFLGA